MDLLKGELAQLRDGKELGPPGPSGPELYRCLKAPCYAIYAMQYQLLSP